jgi:hypothetical protein
LTSIHWAARVVSTFVVIITNNIREIDTGVFIAMEFKTEIGIGIFNRSENTSNFRLTTVISASIIIIAFNWDRSTSIIWITSIVVALIIV